MEQYSPYQNRDKGMIKILKGKSNCRKIRMRVPKCIWDFGIVWEVVIYSYTLGEDGKTPMEVLTLDTIDISERT